MKTPLQYKKQIEELGLDQIKTEDLTPEEVKQSISRLAEAQTHLRNIEVGLNMDMHALRSQYQGRIAALSINTGRKPRVEEEQRAQEERDTKLAPFEDVKTQLQALITDISEKLTALGKIQA